MYRIFLPLPIILCITITFADYAIQTDWSGGDGIYGPVLDWGNMYYTARDIGPYSNPSDLVLLPLEHTVDGDFNNAKSVYSADVNGDGYMDVLGAATNAADITWWENMDGSGISWMEHTVAGDFAGASSVYSADVNGDGYLDVLGAASDAHDITWWENMDGSGTSWTEHTIDGDFNRAKSVYSTDVNGDGHMDVLGAASGPDEITWWENMDGSGTSWTEHTVDGDFLGAWSVYSADVNGDGYMDVLGAARDGDDITWWENMDGSGTSWTEHTVDGNFNGAYSVYSADINGDGYMDILGAACFDDEITWWENMDGSGTSWTEHIVEVDFDWAASVYSTDVNGDGYMDVLGAARWDEDITWWENSDTSPGIYWVEHTVDVFFDGAHSVYAADVNGDGYMDILGAAQSADEIAWWDLTEYYPDGWLESSILDTGCSPQWASMYWNSLEPVGTDLYFQYRTGDDTTSMGAWSDPVFEPCVLSGLLDRLFQYRVTLESDDPELTPTLRQVTLNWDPLGIEDPSEEGTCLLGALCNPSPGPVTIGFSVEVSSITELSIFDVSGRLLREINDEFPQGPAEVVISDLQPGIYFVRMTAGDFTATQHFVIIE